MGYKYGSECTSNLHCGVPRHLPDMDRALHRMISLVADTVCLSTGRRASASDPYGFAYRQPPYCGSLLVVGGRR